MNKVTEHLDHPEMLEVAYYGSPIGSIVVDCVKCGVVVAEIYNEEDVDGDTDEAGG